MTFGITVLGCAGTWASADSACSGYLIDHGPTRVWIDCGPGTLSALQWHCDVTDVDAVVVTHEHPDHCLDLPVLRNAMKHGFGMQHLPLYAPRGVLSLLESLLGQRGITPIFEPRMIGNGSVARLGGLRLQFSRTDHPVETLAVRVDPEDRSAPGIVYSSDTGPGWSVGAFGAGVGLAVVEATFLEGEVGDTEAVHRTAAFTGADARAAGVDRLVITHVPPTGDPAAHRAEAEASFGRAVEVAVPHERFTP